MKTCLCSHPSSTQGKQDVLGSASAGCLQVGGRIRAASPGEFFCRLLQKYRPKKSTMMLLVATRRKFGKPLGEHSGLLLTVTCFGMGNGWSANITLGW